MFDQQILKLLLRNGVLLQHWNMQNNHQNKWARLWNYHSPEKSTKKHWRLPETCLSQPLSSFCLGATYDTLLSLINLYRWHVAPETMCFLCSKHVCTLAHILGACRVASQLGRFPFHHDVVLRVLVSAVKSFLTPNQVSKTKFSYIKFVKAGTGLPKLLRPPKKTSDYYIVCQIVFLFVLSLQ